MDELHPAELVTLSNLLPWSVKQQHEQTRTLLWSNLFGKIKGNKSPEKLWPLYTDKHDPYVEHEKPLTNEEADKIRAEILSKWKK